MITLGIESTAHTFGIGIFDGKRMLANVKRSYTTKSGGMIPAKVGRHHEDAYPLVLDEALAQAGITLSDIKLIAYSAAPGLGHALRIGLAAAQTLGMRLNVPLVPVNHCIAHLEIARFVTGAEDPVLLYASGANTQVIAYAAGRYRIFGETLDIGAGNLLDTCARNMGLGFPGGPKIEKLARSADTKGLLPLPYTIKGMDVAFAGLETHIKRKIGTCGDPELALAIQEHVFAMLTEVAERAMSHLGKDTLVLGGGVACNARLQEMCTIMCEERGASCHIPPKEYLLDNGAMIAYTGWLMHARGRIAIAAQDATIDPYERTDEVEATWM